MEEVAVALGAAFLVMRRKCSEDLQQEPANPHDVKRRVKMIWRKNSPWWLQLSVPAIKQGYQYGLIQNLTQDELEYMAKTYAEDLGEYLNESSADALEQGFHMQLQMKWSDSLAWYRATAAFGLDATQMKAYVKAIGVSANDATFQLLPDAAKSFLDKALAVRAERIGSHESWQSMEVGKALAWLWQQRRGQLPADAEKQWLTAVDEKVCPQCGPLNKKRVPLDEQFETPDGNKFWAPGVHPNCRCDIRLMYPEITNDPWMMVEPPALVQKADWDAQEHPRDDHGRWVHLEGKDAGATLHNFALHTKNLKIENHAWIDGDTGKILSLTEGNSHSSRIEPQQGQYGVTVFGADGSVTRQKQRNLISVHNHPDSADEANQQFGHKVLAMPSPSDLITNRGRTFFITRHTSADSYLLTQVTVPAGFGARMSLNEFQKQYINSIKSASSHDEYHQVAVDYLAQHGVKTQQIEIKHSGYLSKADWGPEQEREHPRGAGGRWKAKPFKEPERAPARSIYDYLPPVQPEHEGIDDIIESVVQDLEREQQKPEIPNPFKAAASSATSIPNPFKETIPNPFKAAAQTSVPNPFKQTGAVANPFKTERPKVRPIHRTINRRILIVLPNGNLAFKDVPVVDGQDFYDDEELQPVAARAFYHHQLAGEAGSPETSDDIDHRVGDPIDFEYPHGFTIGKTYYNNPELLMKEAGEEYSDWDRWHEPDAQSKVSEYHDIYNRSGDPNKPGFRETALDPEVKHRIIAKMSPRDLRDILEMAGKYRSISQVDDNAMRGDIEQAPEDSNIQHAYMKVVEERHPMWVTPTPEDLNAPNPGEEIAAINRELRLIGLKPHEPTYYIIEDHHMNNTVLPSGDIGLAGQYQVRDNIYRNAEMTLMDERPNNISGIHLVYLETIEEPDPEIDEPPHVGGEYGPDDEAQAMRYGTGFTTFARPYAYDEESGEQYDLYNDDEERPATRPKWSDPEGYY